eukprot:12584211-Ditylum_brightwellii.AAC.1
MPASSQVPWDQCCQRVRLLYNKALTWHSYHPPIPMPSFNTDRYELSVIWHTLPSFPLSMIIAASYSFSLD